MSLFDPHAHTDEDDALLPRPRGADGDRLQVDVTSLRTAGAPEPVTGQTQPTTRQAHGTGVPPPADPRVRATIRVPVELARLARAERDRLGTTLTDLVMAAIGDHIDDLTAASDAPGSRFGAARLERRRHVGATSGLQWSGPASDLAALDRLVDQLGMRSRNALFTAVLDNRYRHST